MKLAVLSLLILSSLSFAQSKDQLRLKCQNEYRNILTSEIELQVQAQVEDLKRKEIETLREPILSRADENDILCHSVYRSGQVKRMKKEIKGSLNYVVTYETAAIAIVDTARNRRIKKRMKRRLNLNPRKLKRAINKY